MTDATRTPSRTLGRTLGRRFLATLVGSATVVGTAWAGVGLVPVATSGPAGLQAPAAVTGVVAPVDRALPLPPAAPADLAAVEALRATPDDGPPDLSGLEQMPAGQFLVGTDERSVAPDRAKWQTKDCAEYASNVDQSVDHLATRITAARLPGWPKSPNCVYLGGYGLGPSRAATAVDPTLDYRVQTLAVSNGEQTLVWQTVPFVGFFSRYREDLCDRCGALDVRQAVAKGLGVPVANIAVHANHSHGGADGYGAWGGLPTWYREQVRDQLIAAAYDAVRALRPAVLEAGSVDARAFGRERRSTYHSVADPGAVWLQARALPAGNNGGGTPEVLATLVNYAAHPTVLGAGNRALHGDWPSAANASLTQRFGGLGMVVEGGLGNVVPSRPRPTSGDRTGDGKVDDYDHVLQMGADFAQVVGDDVRRGGARVADNTVRAVDTTITHPITNWTETGLGLLGMLDREFLPGTAGADGPSTYRWDKGGTGVARPCVSAGELSVKTQLSAYRIGELTVVTAPGEIFSGIALVAKAELRDGAVDGAQTMVFAQTQDSLGYVIQSYEQYPYGGLSAGTGGVEYEETFLLDRCFGDHVLDTMLDLGRQVRQG